MNDRELVDVPAEFANKTDNCDECPDIPGHEECQAVRPSKMLVTQFDPQLQYVCIHNHEWWMAA